jgi:hypothetical protein
MPYTTDQIAEMEEALEGKLADSDELMIRLSTRRWAEPRAREFAVHGLCRRLRTMEHCATRVFEIIPPGAVRTTELERLDATNFLQSFLIACFGAIDNIAWLWVLEGAAPGIGERSIPDRYVGLGPGNRDVRQSLPEDVRALLIERNGWFEHLHGYRHALAHRIPLYIPPATVDEAGAAEYQRLEDEEVVAAAAARDWSRYDEAFRLQQNLGRFEPVMMHSYGEQARPVYFHPQMIADFSTALEIGTAILEALPPGDGIAEEATG